MKDIRRNMAAVFLALERYEEALEEAKKSMESEKSQKQEKSMLRWKALKIFDNIFYFYPYLDGIMVSQWCHEILYQSTMAQLILPDIEFSAFSRQ